MKSFYLKSTGLMYKSKTIVAVVQARMDSTRLPNKMMLWLHSHPIIGWVLQRVKQSKYIDKIIFAIPDTASNDILEKYIVSQHCDVFRGSEEDVLGRFYHATRSFQSNWLIRICADNPLVCASEIDALIEHFHIAQANYSYNHIPRNNLYPDGLGVEIVEMQVFEQIQELAFESTHREHIFNYIWDHQSDFSITTFNPENALMQRPDLKLDLDTVEDYSRLLSYNINVQSSALEVVSASSNSCLPS